VQDLKATARITGLFYFILAATGMIGFLVIRANLYDSGDAAATLASHVASENLARLGIAVNLAAVVAQTLAALWFFKLFRATDAFAAGAITAFGFMNAVALLVGTMFLVAALQVAFDPSLAPGGDQAATVQLFYKLNGAAWNTGSMFFGLWLIPMGYLAYTSRLMPRALGVVLMAGGVGYILSGFLGYLLPNAPSYVGDALTGIASVGELWTVGYLLIFGVRSPKPAAA
jgi:hypothetical protein